MKTRLALFGIFGLLLISCKNENAALLEVRADTLVSTHEIKFELHKPDGFKSAEPVTHFPTFNDHPFKVTLGGFIADSEAVLVHAEEVLDKSGVSDYSSLQRDTLSDIEFGVRSMCAELSDEEIKEEHDIQYLQKHGFNLKPGVFLIQFLTNTEDKNSEYVLSFAKTVPSCSIEENPAFLDSIHQRIDDIIQLKRLN